jgi:hypothetical protein
MKSRPFVHLRYLNQNEYRVFPTIKKIWETNRAFKKPFQL